MCAVAAIGPAIGAVGSAMAASQSNKEARRNYQHKLKVRERKWMQKRTTYGTKKVQFEQEVDQANIAAQRAYSRTQQQLNNARSLAILQNQEDFKKMLANEGMIEVSAAERGVRGRNVARQLVMNGQSFGMSQAMRSRGLTQAGYKAKMSNEDVNRQLKGQLNRSFGKVAIQPIADIAPPPPVMQNVGMTVMLGMGQALAAGIGGMDSKGDGLKMNQGGGEYNYSNTPGVTPSFTPPSTIDYGNTVPAGSFGIGSRATDMTGYLMPSNPSYGFQLYR